MGKPTVMQEVRQLYCIYKIQLRERKAPVYQQDQRYRAKALENDKRG